jgi:hypothetical protein
MTQSICGAAPLCRYLPRFGGQKFGLHWAGLGIGVIGSASLIGKECRVNPGLMSRVSRRSQRAGLVPRTDPLSTARLLFFGILQDQAHAFNQYQNGAVTNVFPNRSVFPQCTLGRRCWRAARSPRDVIETMQVASYLLVFSVSEVEKTGTRWWNLIWGARVTDLSDPGHWQRWP